MKQRQSVERKSLFWSRLLGLMIAVAIVTLLVVGGVKNLMGELSSVYDALASSQSELAVAQDRLDASQLALTEANAELDMTHQAIESQSRALHMSRRALAAAGEQIQGLTAERDDLKRGLGDAVYVLAEADRALKAKDRALQATRAQLDRYLQQPKLSVVVTTERQVQMSQRELTAASAVRMIAEGDGGAMFYAGQEFFHEKEQHYAMSERTQVVLTQTGPGDDVLRCLNEGCAMVLAAQGSATHVEAYAYQSQYMSEEMLLIDGRRGRRPGRRR